jgi:hypothetical protein
MQGGRVCLQCVGEVRVRLVRFRHEQKAKRVAHCVEQNITAVPLPFPRRFEGTVKMPESILR